MEREMGLEPTTSSLGKGHQIVNKGLRRSTAFTNIIQFAQFPRFHRERNHNGITEKPTTTPAKLPHSLSPVVCGNVEGISNPRLNDFLLKSSAMSSAALGVHKRCTRARLGRTGSIRATVFA